MPIINRLSLKQIQLNPRLTLGALKVDLTPMLTRPGSLPKIAQRLQSAVSLGRIKAQDMEAVEFDRGLVVHSFLNYQLKPGACSDSRRQQIDAIGLRCSVRMTDAQRAAAFSTPGNVRYVADPALRAAALERAARDTKLAAADVAAQVANFRASLTNATTRQQIETAIGAGEVQRLSALSDDELGRDLIDSGENKVDQFFFVPRVGKFDPVPAGKLALLAKAAPTPPAPPAEPPKQIKTDTVLDLSYYLTGFTLGKKYEWSEQVETTINWCVIGCAKQYHARVYANFSYGFGLRFPIGLSGVYHHESLGADESASVTPQFGPLNGSADEYRKTGLPENQVFDGKELVAEATAGAGFDAHIPIYPDPPALDFQIGKDFTELLPAPFKDGQFEPPAAGTDSPKAQFTFRKFDLLSGLLNFGIVGAQVFPAVEIGLRSDKLTFDLYDEINNVSVKNIESGEKVSLGVNKATHTSSFNISNPVYNLGFVITPGIDAQLFIDLAVWSHIWDFPLWFPQLTVELPPGGVDFACHAGTTCSRRFSYTTVGGATAGGQQPGNGNTTAWGAAFEAKWLPQCADATCKYAIKLVRVGADLVAKRVTDETGSIGANSEVAVARKEAETLAPKLVSEADLRQTGNSVSAISVFAQAVWTEQCKDKDCVLEVGTIAAKMGPRAYQLQIYDPAKTSYDIIGIVGKEYAPQFQAAIDRSQARFGIQTVAAQAEDMWRKQCADKLCRTNITILANKMLPRAIALQKADPGMAGFVLGAIVSKEFKPLFQAEVTASKAR